MTAHNTVVASAYYDAFDGSNGRNIHAAEDKRILDFVPFMETLAAIQRVIPHKYLVIAGGAVRDLYVHDESLIKDIDVFVLDVNEQERIALMNSMYGKITGGNRPQVPGYPDNWGVMWETVYPYLEPNNPYGGGVSLLSRLTGTVSREKEKKKYPVQIVAHAAKTTDQLLDDFDWKACRFAFDGQTVWREGLVDFHMGELHMGTIRNPFYSLARGFYLQEKFKRVGRKLVVGRESMLTLASMMLLDPEAK